MKNAIVDEGAALLPSDDDGLVELPSDDCDDGGASSSQAKAAPTPAKAARHPHRAKAPSFRSPQNPNARKRQRIPEQMRKWLGEPRGDQPRDVIPGPSAGGPRGDHPRDVIPGPSAGDSLAAGDIDLPEEVANDELDDLFVDVTFGSPKKEDRYFAETLRGKNKRARVFPGPTPADVQAAVVHDRAPDVETYLGRSLGGALQDDVMEVFSPPQDSRAHCSTRFAR